VTYGEVKLPGDRELVARAVRNAKHRDQGVAPRWSAVADTFALGSTYATYLCRDHGLDPDEQIGSWPESEDDDLEENDLIRCWCGAIGTYDEMFSDDLAGGCGGMGVIDCRCGGDLCVCHNHGEIQCCGCDDCEEPYGDDYDDY